MTREEEINKEACLREELVNIDAESFIEGAKWADANPKSPWISVDEDLPCNHQELMKNKYFTVRVFVFTVNKDIRTDSMVKESSGWKWVNADFNYIYWMLMPELPTKE